MDLTPQMIYRIIRVIYYIFGVKETWKQMQMTVQTGLVRPAALTAWAYQTIKNDILTLIHPPGTQLNIETLAGQMAISRTPVREALLRLESDGLVQSVPHVGFFVSEITEQDMEELFELRILLECHAVAKATPKLTDEDIETVDRLVAQCLLSVEQEDMVSFLDADTRLHTLLMERAGNRRLILMMETVRDLTYRERGLSVRSHHNVHETLKEHQRLAEALHKHDGKLASQMMGEHLHAVRDRVMAVIHSKPG